MGRKAVSGRSETTCAPPTGEQGALPESIREARLPGKRRRSLGSAPGACNSHISTGPESGNKAHLRIRALFPHRLCHPAPYSPTCHIRNARYSPIDASLFSHLQSFPALTCPSFDRPPNRERRHSAIMQRVRNELGRPSTPATAVVCPAALRPARLMSAMPASICKRLSRAASAHERSSTNSGQPENASTFSNVFRNSPLENYPQPDDRFFHRQYREIPGNIINALCGHFPPWFLHGISNLEFPVENRDSEKQRLGNIPSQFFDSQSAPFRVISRETTHEGVENYASKHDGEPAPSGGSTRARLQGNHDLASERAGQCDQPLRQRSPLSISARSRDGGSRSSLHAREGKDVM